MGVLSPAITARAMVTRTLLILTVALTGESDDDRPGGHLASPVTGACSSCSVCSSAAGRRRNQPWRGCARARCDVCLHSANRRPHVIASRPVGVRCSSSVVVAHRCSSLLVAARCLKARFRAQHAVISLRDDYHRLASAQWPTFVSAQ